MSQSKLPEGENPEHVIQQYTSVIGRPMLPPFWAMGFQLSRYRYHTFDHVKQVIKRNLEYNMPIVSFNHI